MTNFAFVVIAQAMEALGIEYDIFRYSGVKSTYFVGTFSQVPVDSESGQTEHSFYITGFSRGKWFELLDAAQRIEDYFTREGRSFVAPSGTTIVVCHETTIPIPEEDLELKSLQITLTIKEWKV